MRLAYQAFDKSGRAIQDTIEAASIGEATEQLRRQGLYITQILQSAGGTQDEAAPASGGSRFRSLGGGGRHKNLAMFTRQLYVLLSTGTPMVEALSALERQTRNPSWRHVIGELRKEVERGRSLSDAMSDHPWNFDAIYRSLITAGEQGGKFEPILDRLATLTRKQMATRNALIGALVYPVILLAVSSVVLVGMLVFVLPRFTVLFKTLNLPLPPSTQAMLAVSEFLTGYWWAIVPSVLVATAAGVWWVRTDAGRDWTDTVLVRTPLIGPVTRSFITARIVRLLGVLSDSYVPLLDALDLAKQAAGNLHYRQLLANAQDAVTRGEPISTAFADAKLINPTVYEALRSGEATGKVSSLLLNMADFLDEENEVVLKTATGLLEPLILIGLGVLVGLVAISMFLPLFDLTAQVGGGG